MNDDEVAREAARFARYLIGENALPEEIERYRRALEARGAIPERERDRRLLEWMRRRPWLIGPLDAGLALTDPESVVRFRLCLMLAVLEASPAHCRRFLPAAASGAAWPAFALRMAGAALRSAFGLVLVRSWGVLWK